MEQLVADIPDVFREFEYEKTPMADGLPSVTLGDVERAVKHVTYYTHGTTTICAIDLDTGHTVTGTSACVVPEKFNAKIGSDIAFKKALDEVWALLGYELRLKLRYKAKVAEFVSVS